MTEKMFLRASAAMVEALLAAEPVLGVPVDPETADFMGAYVDDGEPSAWDELQVESGGEGAAGHER